MFSSWLQQQLQQKAVSLEKLDRRSEGEKKVLLLLFILATNELATISKFRLGHSKVQINLRNYLKNKSRLVQRRSVVDCISLKYITVIFTVLKMQEY